MGIREQLRGFPVWQMSVVCMIRFSEPITFTSLFPYVYFMIRDFHVTDDPTQIPKYTGILAASFALSQFFCCIHWGRLSDRVGRKPVLITGLLGSAVCLLVFGFSQNFYMALAARTMAGALNGNVAVMQTVVGEIVQERKHQSLAFAALPLFWNVGCVVGPLIGGSAYLTRPRMDTSDGSALVNGIRKFGLGSVGMSHILEAGDSFYERFINRFPYALSNVVVSFFLINSALVAFFFLEETESRARRKRDLGLLWGDRFRSALGFKVAPRPWNRVQRRTYGATSISEGNEGGEYREIRGEYEEYRENGGEYGENGRDWNRENSLDESAVEEYTGDESDFLEHVLPRKSSRNALRRYSALSLQPTIMSEREDTKNFLQAIRNRDIFTNTVIGTMLMYFLIAFHALIHTEFVTVFLAGDYQVESLQFPWHIKGGMGWNSQDIGTMLSTVGLVGCFSVIVIFPFLDRHMGTINGFRLASCLFPIAYTVLPYIIFTTPGYNPQFSEGFSRRFVYFNTMLATFGNAIAFPQIAVLVFRATKPRHRAFVNATCMSANSLARFIAPMTWGGLTSFFDKRNVAQVPWNILAGLALISLALSFFIDEEDEELGSEESGSGESGSEAE